MPDKKSAKNGVGCRGKPGPGRPKGVPNKITQDVRLLAQQYGASALKTLDKIMRDEKKPAAARVSAAKEILDRAYGKSPQPIAVNNANLTEAFGQLLEKLPG